MGFDKASILIEGEPLAARLARTLRESGWEPTILGRTAIEGYAFHLDVEAGCGPLAALRTYSPNSDLVFVLSCDVPMFDPSLCQVLELSLNNKQAVIPSLEGRLQPLCGLYRHTAWDKLPKIQSPRIMDWVAALEIMVVTEEDLLRAGAQLDWCRGVNSPSELNGLLGSTKWTSRGPSD